MTHISILITLVFAAFGDCARIRKRLSSLLEEEDDSPKLQVCSGIRVEKCYDCQSDFACDTCYKIDESNPSKKGIVCTSSLSSSSCKSSDKLGATTVKCRIARMPMAAPRPSAPNCPWLNEIAATQELVSVPDNSFNLCLPSDPLPNEGVLQLQPVVKRVPLVITTAVEWLLFAGGYTAKKNGTADIGHPGTVVPPSMLKNMNYLPSSSHRWIAYTQRVLDDVPMPTKLIVYCHANADAVWKLHQRKQLDELARAVNGMLVGFEFPGYGGEHGTQGQSTITSVTFVTMAGLNYARQVWGWQPKDIILVGRSIGTGAAAEAAAMYESFGLSVGGLILMAPYYSIKKLVAGFVGGEVIASWATNSHYFQTGLNIAEMTETPTLIAHGQLDRTIGIDHAENIYEEMCDECKSSGRMQFIRLLNRAHNDFTITDVLKNGGRDWIATNPSLTDGTGPHEAFRSRRCIADAKIMCRARDGLTH